MYIGATMLLCGCAVGEASGNFETDSVINATESVQSGEDTTDSLMTETTIKEYVTEEDSSLLDDIPNAELDAGGQSAYNAENVENGEVWDSVTSQDYMYDGREMTVEIWYESAGYTRAKLCYYPSNEPGDKIMNMSALEFSITENIITILFVVVVVGYILWLVVKEVKKRTSNKTITTSAKVLSKASADYVHQQAYMTTGQVDLGVAEKGQVYKILFEEQGTNKQLELEVSQNVFDKIQEGASGELVYKGDALLQFGDIATSNDNNGATFVTMGRQI